jgi:hypothetical protein
MALKADTQNLGVTLLRCQVMRVLMAMKQQISWQEQDLKIRS